MTNLECPECGSTSVQTTVELEHLHYGRGELVESKTPVRHCKDCNFNWLDKEGMDAQDEAVRQYVRNKNARHAQQDDV